MKGLGRADLDAAARELQCWGLAFSDSEDAVAVPPNETGVAFWSDRVGLVALIAH